MDLSERTGRPEHDSAPGGHDARQIIMSDLRPVRRLAAPWKRGLLVIVPWAIASAALVWVISGPGSSFPAQGSAAVIGVSVVSLVLSCALGWLLARESVPGLLPPGGLMALCVVAVVAARVLAAGVIHAWRSFPVQGGQGVPLAVICAGAISVIALPCLAGLLALACRGQTTRTLVPALLAGTAAAIGSEACWQLHCPFTSPSHVIAGHLSPIIVLVGLWLGLAFTTGRRHFRSKRLSRQARDVGS